ncbi:sodium:dicarboxylate symporter [Citromicrobium sp. JL31]|uniref:dicarboxylate/amino acid:cation symporter n=1 Tax=Citromicrobium sp. JL477 TaxID=1634516 RepID=UPI0005903566|nr:MULTISPECIES: cation:dicarboxylase symporter family transporter [Citromicrobium]ALG60092.1 sodium:dicarboxylate symporter [Citromicrobium sp. JL477]KPM17526.1 sodium:dicarboxylate symporter [Citromicrobium sp. JL31]KPM18761.1 sodium:dicarboxylate symporter [Citromicrobium sp. JL1351]KPM29750.1 sodium:dicarboxylate symporter [Citromicrobium sp. JL2201]
MSAPETTRPARLVTLRLPVWWTFGGLVAGLIAGSLIAGRPVADSILPVTAPAGALWLRALQMTIIPLVAALLVLGITQLASAARAGATARRMLVFVAAALVFGGVATLIAMPLLLDAVPAPAGAQSLLAANVEPQEVPGLSEFILSLIAPNIIAAAAETAMLPLTIFFALFAVAITRLPDSQSAILRSFFEAVANAMLMLIGWVLWVAPVGVFALALGVAVRAGGDAAFLTLIHYIATVAAMGGIVLVAAFVVGAVRHGPLPFARALLPAQAVAISTQSSLASLPAMLASARRLDISENVADFVLPLSVAIFRATSPAMNLAVAIYVAHLFGIELGLTAMLAGLAVAFVISIGSVSLPGTISFVVSIGPIALAMGVPVEPLALLVAVEMIPDIMRTLANVTADVALASATDGEKGENLATDAAPARSLTDS